jgi:uncharacterized protein
VVKAGDIVRVKVMEVDIPRKRIGLSMRLDDQPGEKTEGRGGRRGGRRESGGRAASGQKAPQGAMAGALAQALASARKGGR